LLLKCRILYADIFQEDDNLEYIVDSETFDFLSPQCWGLIPELCVGKASGSTIELHPQLQFFWWGLNSGLWLARKVLPNPFCCSLLNEVSPFCPGWPGPRSYSCFQCRWDGQRTIRRERLVRSENYVEAAVEGIKR
jgi:hypothetical protein